MNKVYKLVWSKAHNMYIAVAEFAKSQTKFNKKIKHSMLAGIIACSLGCGISLPVFAEYVPDRIDKTVSWDDFVSNYAFAYTSETSYWYWVAIDKQTGEIYEASGVGVGQNVNLTKGNVYGQGSIKEVTGLSSGFTVSDNGDYVNRAVAVKWPPQTRFYASFTFSVSLPSESVPVQAHIPVTVFYPPCRHESVPDTTSARIHTGSSAGSP